MAEGGPFFFFTIVDTFTCTYPNHVMLSQYPLPHHHHTHNIIFIQWVNVLRLPCLVILPIGRVISQFTKPRDMLRMHSRACSWPSNQDKAIRYYD